MSPALQLKPLLFLSGVHNSLFVEKNAARVENSVVDVLRQLHLHISVSRLSTDKMGEASTTPQCILTLLPAELFTILLSLLSNRDLKHLRQTCSALQELAHLRFSRVFLSANSLNISVFRAVADDETLRHQIIEIVWDDARLLSDVEFASQRAQTNYQRANDVVGDGAGDCPRWFQDGRQHSLEVYLDRFSEDNKTPADIPTLEESWSYYQRLLQDQEQCLDANADVEAFRYGLRRFPSLTCVTLSPAIHGQLGRPIYETPMIRSLPKGLCYPLPYGWPRLEFEEAPIDSLPWQESHDGISDTEDNSRDIGSDYQILYGKECTAEKYRDKWHGFRAAMDVLAKQKHNVSELLIEPHHMNTGISCHIFDRSCWDYDNFAALLKRPGFRRLGLALFTGLLEHDDWTCYLSGYLREALAGAEQLEHFHLQSTMDIDIDGTPSQIDDPEAAIADGILLPLRTILPIDTWKHLSHFGLSTFLIKQSDLVSVLHALPETLRSVELSYLGFLAENDCYRHLLREMRNTLGWKHRPPAMRPTVAISTKRQVGNREGRVVWLKGSVGAFLYDYGLNPFGDEEEGCCNFVVEGRGAVELDQFDVDFRRPYVVDQL